MCQGLTLKATAGRLAISLETVKTHVANTRKKLGCHSTTHSLAVMLLWK
jgi:DNA-binding CsgD family transcriptional regulator